MAYNFNNPLHGPTLGDIEAEEAKKNLVQNFDDINRNIVPGNTSLSAPNDDFAGITRNTLYEDAIRSAVVDPGLNYMDYQQTRLGPVTAQGYSGKTFSAPTFAAGGMRVPTSLINKNVSAAIEQRRQDKLAGLKLDYEIQQIKDPILNNIFIDNQFEYYDQLAQSVADERFDGDISKARKYLNTEQKTLEKAGMKWSTYRTAFDQSFDNYLKYQSGPKGPGQTRFGEETKKLMQEYEQTILNSEDFDPKDIDKYSQFLRKFNERTSIAEAAQSAAEADLQGIYSPEEIETLLRTNDYDITATRKVIRDDFRERLAPAMLELYGGDLEDYTPEQQKLFVDAMEMYFEKQVLDNIKTTGKFNAAARIKIAKETAKYSPKTQDMDATNPDAYTRTPYNQTAFKTGSTTEEGDPDYYNVSTYNVVTLPDAETKEIQISTQGSAEKGYVAWNKQTGEPYITKGNEYFKPRNTFVMYVADEDIKVGDNMVYEKGQPVDKEVVFQNNPNAIFTNKIRKRRYVEGITTNKRLKDPDYPEDGAVTDYNTVIVPYEMIGADMQTAYPALPSVVNSFGTEEGQIKGVIKVSEYNRAKNTNYTYLQMKNNPLLQDYVIQNE